MCSIGIITDKLPMLNPSQIKTIANNGNNGSAESEDVEDDTEDLIDNGHYVNGDHDSDQEYHSSRHATSANSSSSNATATSGGSRP